MNSNQVTGILRAVVPATLAWVAAKGWIQESTVADVTAAVVTIGAAAWSIYTNSTQSQINFVQALPAAQVSVSDPKLLSPGVNLVPPTVIKAPK